MSNLGNEPHEGILVAEPLGRGEGPDGSLSSREEISILKALEGFNASIDDEYEG